jgi:glycine/D-amino acid oxidase-like deaminating enzyme
MEMGVAHELIDAGAAAQVEPALNPTTPLHGAIHLPQDGVATAGSSRTC